VTTLNFTKSMIALALTGVGERCSRCRQETYKTDGTESGGVGTLRPAFPAAFCRPYLVAGGANCEARFAILGSVSTLEVIDGIKGLLPRIKEILPASINVNAVGDGEGGEQNAPLGRAVIGGLLVATAATLFLVPAVFSVLHRRDRNMQPGDASSAGSIAAPSV
jgi:hypothetical protein